MRRELGIARCGLACCLCSENTTCGGCGSSGCPDRGSCQNLTCSQAQGISHCCYCPTPCRKGLLAKIKPYGFTRFARLYGMEALLSCLAENEKLGVVYHREGIFGDYDDFADETQLMNFLITGPAGSGLCVVEKGPFSVLGKLGSSDQGEGFVRQLWAAANSQFSQVAHLARRDSQGNLAGIWGAMSDRCMTFRPWQEDFTQGLYLAGVECLPGAQAPAGWVRWDLPGFVYLTGEDGPGAFSRILAHMKARGLPLAGAVQEYTHPVTGKGRLYFPLRRCP